jgi:pimeloyl-ACP methyl ester carboxylesterase
VPTIGGVDIAVTETGTGPAFLWGHGFTGSVAQEDVGRLLDWKRLGTHAHLVRWDAPGHGRSTGTRDPDDYRWDRIGDALLDLADALGVERFVAGGVSMGAATALHAAVRAPARVIGLVLVLPPTAYETRAAQVDDYTTGAERVEREGVEAYVRVVDAKPQPGILTGAAVAVPYETAVPAELLPAALRGAARSDLPAPEQVRAVTAPVLILAWDTDPGHPLSTAERLAELLPDAELVIARRLRDVVPWTDRVAAFLDEHARG